MRKRLLLALFAVALLALTLSASPVNADETTVSKYYIEGHVADTNRVALEGVIVTIVEKNTLITQYGVTDAEGHFRVGVAINTDLMISFTCSGHKFVTCPNTSFPSDSNNSNYLNLDLSKAAYDNATRTYTITGPVENMQCAIMVAFDGIVNGIVSSESGPIKNAVISLAPTEAGVKYPDSVRSDDSGRYQIKCPTGTYTLTVGCQGFNKSDAYSVTVSENPSTVNVTLEKNELKKYLGLDAAHILMLIGVILSIMLAVAAWFQSERMRRPNSLEIVDDSAEDYDSEESSDEP
ncbi:MAG: carboxypeptidase-like regulatory domain-containing protein [Methanomassiliicoccaceae archaeon]|nr:carboxypeptidase-like regulatory domain-containing protein [Methanomassiliicoccaceae archaeon]